MKKPTERSIKPPPLKPGSALAILSPSWGGPAVFPELFDAGCRVLKNMGFHLVEFPTTRMSPGELDRNPKLRAQDFHSALRDPSIDGIVASIGGNDSIRILPYLDLPLFQKNPKLILGHSDATTFLSWLNQNGIVTYYGNSVMSGFAQLEHFPEALQWYKNFLYGNAISLEPFPRWTHGERQWSSPEKQPPQFTNPGPTWIQGSGVTQGKLFGGCFEVLEMLKATPYWPSPDFWNGKVLFLETSEEKPSPKQIMYWLRNYGAQGIFRRLSALWIGRPKDYTAEENKELQRILVGIVAEEWESSDLPIVADLDFGHTDPRWILPLGVEVETDCSNQKLSFLDSPFSS